MRKLMIGMLIIISIVTGGGVWVLHEWHKRYPITGHLDEMRMHKGVRFTRNFSPVKQVKAYQGKWHKTYLEVIK